MFEYFCFSKSCRTVVVENCARYISKSGRRYRITNIYYLLIHTISSSNQPFFLGVWNKQRLAVTEFIIYVNSNAARYRPFLFSYVFCAFKSVTFKEKKVWCYFNFLLFFNIFYYCNIIRGHIFCCICTIIWSFLYENIYILIPCLGKSCVNSTYAVNRLSPACGSSGNQTQHSQLPRQVC